MNVYQSSVSTQGEILFFLDHRIMYRENSLLPDHRIVYRKVTIIVGGVFYSLIGSKSLLNPRRNETPLSKSGQGGKSIGSVISLTLGWGSNVAPTVLELGEIALALLLSCSSNVSSNFPARDFFSGVLIIFFVEFESVAVRGGCLVDMRLQWI